MSSRLDNAGSRARSPGERAAARDDQISSREERPQARLPNRSSSDFLVLRERATGDAQRATFLGILGLVALLGLGRLLLTAFGYGIPAWFDEELNPLIGLITQSRPIAQIDARQYGVVVFLVFDPALR